MFLVEWGKAAHQVAAHRSSFGELVCTMTPPVPCSVLDLSVKQQIPWVLASMMSELSLFL